MSEIKKIYINKEIPLNISKNLLKTNIKQYFETSLSIYSRDKILKIIKKYITSLSRSYFDNLVTNQILPIDRDKFWDIIYDIYNDLNYYKIGVLNTDANIILKGGNIFNLIFYQFLKWVRINSKPHQKDITINYFRLSLDKYFLRSDIDLSLVVNYEELSKKKQIIDANSDINIYKSIILERFDTYKQYLDNFYLNPLSSINDNNLIKNINSNIDDLIDEINGDDGIYSSIKLKTKETHNKLKELILYIESFKLTSISKFQGDASPNDIYTKNNNNFYLMRKVDNKVENTNLYISYAERVYNPFTINNELKDAISDKTSDKMSKHANDFSLIRLLYKFKVVPAYKPNYMNIRGEVIDFSINNRSDYYGKHLYEKDDYLEEYTIKDGRKIKSYSINYLINELMDIMFGVERQNIELINTYKFEKRLVRLYTLIIINLIYTEKNINLVNDILYHIKSTVNNFLTIEKMSEIVKDNLDYNMSQDMPSLSGSNPLDDSKWRYLRRSYSANYQNDKNNLTKYYIKSNNENINNIILENNNPFYLLFESLFRIVSRIIDKIDTNQIDHNIEQILKLLNQICDKFIYLLKKLLI